jgi:hypothetical protein
VKLAEFMAKLRVGLKTHRLNNGSMPAQPKQRLGLEQFS